MKRIHSNCNDWHVIIVTTNRCQLKLTIGLKSMFDWTYWSLQYHHIYKYIYIYCIVLLRPKFLIISTTRQQGAQIKRQTTLCDVRYINKRLIVRRHRPQFAFESINWNSFDWSDDCLSIERCHQKKKKVNEQDIYSARKKERDREKMYKLWCSLGMIYLGLDSTWLFW